LRIKQETEQWNRSDAKAGSQALEGRAKLVESDFTNDIWIQWQDRIGLEMRIS
jgi:hypothetical protein